MKKAKNNNIKYTNCKKRKDVNRARIIKAAMALKGVQNAHIAEDLGVSRQAINRALYGLSTISRFDSWVKENLGIAI